MSEYASKGDKNFSDLKSAKNDVRAIRDFLLQSIVKFREEDIIILIDPSIYALRDAMK